MFWYHDELERLEKKVRETKFTPKTVFFGSSTFTLWSDVEKIFKDQNALNLGFGGSTLASCTWFFDRIFKDINAIESLIIYAGDNDLGEGRHPEEVVLFFENLVYKIREKYGNIKCSFIAIKPSIARRNLRDSIHYTNKCVQTLTEKDDYLFFVDIFENLLDNNGNADNQYFEDDGLHFNTKGYEILTEALQKNKHIFPEKIFQNI